MARTPQTPEEKKRSGIILIVFAAIMLLIGGIMQIQYTQIKRACTEYVNGVITEVESKRVRRRSGRSSRTHTEYQAHIRVEADALFRKTEVVTGWTRTYYHSGEYIKVYYNPADTSVYYAEGDAPQNGIPLIIVSVIFLALGAGYLISGTHERKRLWETQTWD